MVMYHAHLQTDVLLTAPIITLICNNPRASELLNHNGSNARRFCRICMTDKCSTPNHLSTLRSKTKTLNQISVINRAKNETERKELRATYGIHERYNPLFILNVDLFRSTPVECLHTILLGPYKYLTGSLMNRLTPKAKLKVKAKIAAFDCAGFDKRLSTALCQHHQSFNGQGFKVLAQIAVFVLWDTLQPDERTLWLNLSKIFRFAYCQPTHHTRLDELDHLCHDFLTAVQTYDSSLFQKPNFHLLHLSESMREFGPTSAYNAERCGEGLCQLLMDVEVQSLIHGIMPSLVNSDKAIHQPGALRKDTHKVTKLENCELSDEGTSYTIRELERKGFLLRKNSNLSFFFLSFFLSFFLISRANSGLPQPFSLV